MTSGAKQRYRQLTDEGQEGPEVLPQYDRRLSNLLNDRKRLTAPARWTLY